MSPANQTRLYFQDAVLISCVATGIPVPTVTWWRARDGFVSLVPVTPNARIKIDSEVSDTLIHSTLEIHEVELQDAGKYVCLAENRVGMNDAGSLLGVDGEDFLI